MPDAALAKDDPRIIAWDAWTRTPEYANTLQWAAHGEHRKGSLWAAFLQGYETAHPMTPEKPRHDGECVLMPLVATDAILKSANDWSRTKYGKPVGYADLRECYAAFLAASPATAALGTQEGEAELINDLQGAYNTWRLKGYAEGSGTLFKEAADTITSQARTIEALRAAAEPFAKAWVLIASQQQLAERLSLAQIAELACHELSGADFQRVARTLKEHPNG